jgi:hypothetical protein
MGDETGVHPKQKTVCKTRKARDENEEVGVRDAGCEQLGNAEDGSRDEETPEARPGEFRDEQVGADAAKEAAGEAAEGEDGDVHVLPLLDEVWVDIVIVMFPEGLCIVADIAVPYQHKVQGKETSAYLIVIRPMPVIKPSIQKSCQNSGCGSSAKPRRSRCVDSWFLSASVCFDDSRSSPKSDDRSDVSSSSALSSKSAGCFKLSGEVE